MSHRKALSSVLQQQTKIGVRSNASSQIPGLLIFCFMMPAATSSGQTQAQLKTADTPAYPAPAVQDVSRLGANIQRTMTLLATSTPQKRHTVKILFYGQSITQQKWADRVAEHLRQQFPHANLIIKNRAIGGFSSQILVKTAEHDLYPFYPDLVIFHVYGSHIEYENIIKNMRSRTTAEILMQTDHVTEEKDLTEEIDPVKLSAANWNAWMNHAFLPQTVRKYGAELADQRAAWKTYLQANKLKPSALLSDTVHLNDWGNFLMAELVKPYLRHDPKFPDAAWKNLVRDYRVGSDAQWKNGTLTLPFNGNRVDIIAAASGANLGTARILIDGKKPSEFAELYAVTRPSGTPHIGWPGIIRVGHDKPLILEEWTARVTEINEDASRFKFEVRGSKTGFDGSGTSDEKFVSNSGRVVIEPGHWWFHHDWQLSKKPTPAGFEVRWQVVPLFFDFYTPPKMEDRTREHAVTLAQGLSNGPHTLQIITDGKTTVPISAIRVYEPPLH